MWGENLKLLIVGSPSLKMYVYLKHIALRSLDVAERTTARTCLYQSWRVEAFCLKSFIFSSFVFAYHQGVSLFFFLVTTLEGNISI